MSERQRDPVAIALMAAGVLLQFYSSVLRNGKDDGMSLPHLPSYLPSLLAPAMLLVGIVILVYQPSFRKWPFRKNVGKQPNEPEESNLEILSAHYGVESKKEVDVTELVKSRKRDALAIYVNDSTFGCDPYPNGVNTLRVEYKYHGLFMKARKLADGLLVLPEDQMAKKAIEFTEKRLKACEEMLKPQPTDKAPEPVPPDEKRVEIISGWVAKHPREADVMVIALEIAMVKPRRIGVLWEVSMKHEHEPSDFIHHCEMKEYPSGLRIQYRKRATNGTLTDKVDTLPLKPIHSEFPREGCVFFHISNPGEFSQYIFGSTFEVWGRTPGASLPQLSSRVTPHGRWLRPAELAPNFDVIE